MQLTDPVILLSVLIVASILLVLWVYWYSERKRKKLLVKGQLVRGTVVAFAQKNTGKANQVNRTEINFSTSSGATVTVVQIGPSNSRKYSIGDYVDLYYDINKPENFIVKGGNSSKKLKKVVVVIALILYLFFFAGLFLL